MENDDIAQLLNNIVKKSENSLNINEEPNTLSQARQLLQTWADHTESFKKRNSKNDLIVNKGPKTAKYRKLDAPMMVAKKITNRPSIDPTLIMEARLAHVKEMKAERIKRMENKENSSISKKSQASSVMAVDIPDIDAEINLHRIKVAERMKEKQKELDNRSRRTQKNKAIDENMAILIAQEYEDKAKTEKDIEKDSEIVRSLTRSFHLYQALLKKRTFFFKWVSECNFETKSYQKAARLNNFRRKSSSFANWKNRFRRKQQEREVSMLERQLRQEKQLESIADQKYKIKLLRKSLVQWKVKYKTSIEYKVIEEQHKKRRTFLASHIDLDQIDSNLTEEKNDHKKVEEIKTLKFPKTKIKKIKPNQKLEAMTKRMEEQKAKKLEKAQKEAEAVAFKEEKNYKQQMEIQRKKKEEHRLFLEQEKLKREEIKRKQEQYQRDAQRKKYCEQISQNFRLNRLKASQFNLWKKILVIKKQFEVIAENHYIHHLVSASFKGLIQYSYEKKNQKDINLTTKFNCFILQKFFFIWKEQFHKFQKIEFQISFISNRWRMCRAFRILIEEKKKRRKAKYAMAARHSNMALLRKFFKAWPIGCKIIQNEEERENNRQNLMSKALQFLEEINSDDFDEL